MSRSRPPRRVALLLGLVGLAIVVVAVWLLFRTPPRKVGPIQAPSPAATAAGPVLRFVALGDTGKGNDIEKAVAQSIGKTCIAHGGCAFGLLLGDNIYPSGVESADDPNWKTKFEEPYVFLHFPFYAVLGNHDYGESWQLWKAQAELAYAKKNPRFIMPAREYSFSAGPIDFFALDTNALFWGADGEEKAALRSELDQSHNAWRIAFGHHTYRSNGPHGNAGRYEGLPNPNLPAAGGTLAKFFDDEVLGHVDAYLCGHDHTLQDLGDEKGTALIVSGAGSSTTSLPGHNPSLYQALEPGFVLVEATPTKLQFTFVDSHTHELWHRSLTKPQ